MRAKRGLVTLGWVAFAATAGCGNDETPAGGAGGASATTGAGATGTTSGAGGGSTSTSSTGGGSSGDDIPGGGTILFAEPFDDADFAARGWYDGPSGTISTSEARVGGGAFECDFAQGSQGCSGGHPARHGFAESETVYLAFYLKFSDDWIGSGLPYHPHMFHFVTNLDDDYVGPANSFLTTYTEVVEGRAFLGLQDSRNVDTNCILLNNDTFVGCNGDFDSYVFDENRSACACNGLVGDVEGRDCFDNGNYWYSSRFWRSPEAAFGDGPAPFDKNAWHFVEVYFALNSIADGVGIADGKIRWVQDGATLISYDAVLFRTGAHPTMAFDQFAMLPYIGAGSPIGQRFWVDELVVATARP